MRIRDPFVLALCFCIGAAAFALAQDRGDRETPEGEIVLKLEREYFVYPLEERRDPFVSLAARQDMGPRFEELRVTGIIYSSDGGSVALLSDADGRAHRVRRGMVVGNARVVDIGQTHVVFAVENFGVVRQERLEMRPNETDEVLP